MKPGVKTFTHLSLNVTIQKISSGLLNKSLLSIISHSVAYTILTHAVLLSLSEGASVVSMMSCGEVN